MKITTLSALLLPALALAANEAQEQPSEPQPRILEVTATPLSVLAQATAAPSTFQTSMTAEEQRLE